MVIQSREEQEASLWGRSLGRRGRLAIRLLFVFGLVVFSLAGFADYSYAETLDYNVNVEPALNVTIPTDTISLLLDPTNKTFSSQELNISVGTNNPYGYRLTMSSTGTSLIHTEDSNYTIPTLPNLAGGYTDESFIADKWGYKQDSSAWNSYTSGVTLLESNAPVNNDNTNLSFGAKIDYNQAPGNYTLVLNFNAVAKVATNDLVITFAGEGVESVKVCKVAGDCTGDNLVGTVSTSGSSVPGLEDGSTYYLYPVFNANYEFVSWEKTSTAGTISATDTLNPTFTMTDEPASVTITGQSSLITMQDFTAANASAMAEGDTTTLRDARDGQVYTVAKINGNVWMTRNLAIGCDGFNDAYGSSVSSKTLTSTDSNVATTWSTPTTLLSQASAETHTADHTDPRMQCDSTYGAWYNYAATTAGTITGDSNDTADAYNVCPKGWTLFTKDQFSGITSYSSAFSPVIGGDYIDGSPYKYSYRGYWWSATVDDAKSTLLRYLLRWDSNSNLLETTNGYRYVGAYVRCIRSS